MSKGSGIPFAIQLAYMRRLLPIASLALLACHDSKRENPFDPVLTPAPQLQVVLDDAAGTATLTWTPHSGETSFAAYWVP